MISPIIDLTKNIFKFGVNPLCAHRIFIYYFKFIILEPFRLLEELFLYKKIKSFHFKEEPIFILGYYRSGTTHLHEVLLADKRFGYINFFQCLFPGGFFYTEKWLKPILNPIAKFLKIKHPAHKIPFHFDLPAEEDVTLVASGFYNASNWGQIFTKNFKRFFNKTVFLENISDKETKELKNEFHRLFVKAALKNKNKRMIFKSPPQMARIKLILDMYPHAKFIYIHRNPYDVFKSNQKLWESFKLHALHKFTQEKANENIVWSMNKCYDQYEKNKKLISQKNLVEIGFDELQNYPMETIEKIYTHLNIKNKETAFPHIKAYIEKKHKGSPPPYKFLDSEIHLINQNLSDNIKELGYELNLR